MDVQAPGNGSGSKLRCLHPSLSFSASASDSKHKQLQNSRSFDPGPGSVGGCQDDTGPGGAQGVSLAVPATKVSRSTSPFSFYRSRSLTRNILKLYSRHTLYKLKVRYKFWFRSGKKKIEKQKKIPDEFISPTSPLSISPGPYDPCSRKVPI